MRTSSPLKYHGSKSKLARRIISLFPPHKHYVEPYAGSLAVLLARNPQNVSEVVNDIDGDLSNFWRVLREPDTFDRFRRRVLFTPFSEAEFHDAERVLFSPDVTDPVVRAVAFFVHVRQSLAGRRDCFTPTSRTRTRRGMNEQCSAWLSAIDGLPVAHARLSRVLIRCADAVEVIEAEDGPETLFMCDPPYVPACRTAPNVYRHEMSLEQHERLLAVLCNVRGKVILCGYPNDLYDSTLKGWRMVDTKIPNHAAGGKRKRTMTERLWLNW